MAACHCSNVTTSTAWPSMVTVLSDIRVVTGAMATCTGPLPWARLVTTVWYMLTGIWTSPGETKGRRPVGIGLSFPDAGWAGQPAPDPPGHHRQPHVLAHRLSRHKYIPPLTHGHSVKQTIRKVSSKKPWKWALGQGLPNLPGDEPACLLF